MNDQQKRADRTTARRRRRRLPVKFGSEDHSTVAVIQNRRFPHKLDGGPSSEVRRLRLIAHWAGRLYTSTESWRGSLGMEIAYLFAAIARNQKISLKPRSLLVRLLRCERITSRNRIWKFIVLED